MGKSKASPDKVKAAERRLNAWKMRNAGFTYDEIATAIGVSSKRARDYIVGDLDKINHASAEEAERWRALLVERLEMATKGIVLAVQRGDIKAIMAWIKLNESVRGLLGLDAAGRIELSGPNGAPIQTESISLNLNLLTKQETTEFLRIYKKATGIGNGNQIAG